MKRTTLIILTIGLLIPMMFSMQKASAQKSADDSLKLKVSTLHDKISGVEERLATAEGDLAKLTKIKISGYIQAQWVNNEASNVFPNNYFMLRRARIKFTYEPVNGIAFVLQPDFQPGNITIKDAYAIANEKWLKTFSLWAGKFNRPNYEVEYSSSSREVPERSRVIRAIYPDERAIGAKLEINPPKIPLKVQLAVLNGNDGIGIAAPSTYNFTTNKWDANTSTVGQNIDFDNFKDIMLRVTYGFKFGKIGGLTIGAHGYLGSIKANSVVLVDSKYALKDSLSSYGDIKNVKYITGSNGQVWKTNNGQPLSVGKSVPKRWVGFEAQLYLDVLGGLTLKGEYIFGVNSTPGYNATATSATTTTLTPMHDTLMLTNYTQKDINNAPAISRNFMGYYVYLVKNVGKHNQFAVRYDYYNPNTKLEAKDLGVVAYNSKTDVTKESKTYAGTSTIIGTDTKTRTITESFKSGTADIPYGTWTLAYTYFFDDNIKFMIGYEIPINKKVGTVTNGVGSVKSDYNVNAASGTAANNTTGTYYYNDVIKQNVLTVRMQVKF